MRLLLLLAWAFLPRAHEGDEEARAARALTIACRTVPVPASDDDTPDARRIIVRVERSLAEARRG